MTRLWRLPVVKQILDAAYATFAKNRLRLTGRACEDGVCEVPARAASSAAQG